MYLLVALAIHRPADVRPILKAYAGKDVALEYGKFEEEMKKKHIEEWEKSGKKNSVVQGVSIGKLFGGVSFFSFLPFCPLHVPQTSTHLPFLCRPRN